MAAGRARRQRADREVGPVAGDPSCRSSRRVVDAEAPRSCSATAARCGRTPRRACAARAPAARSADRSASTTSTRPPFQLTCVRSSAVSTSTVSIRRKSQFLLVVGCARNSGPTNTSASPTFRLFATPFSHVSVAPRPGACALGQPRADRVPFGPRRDLLDRLERLRLLVGARHALHLQARGERQRGRNAGDERARLGRQARRRRLRRFEREREPASPPRRRGAADSRSAWPSPAATRARSRCAGTTRWRCAPGRTSARRRRTPPRRSAPIVKSSRVARAQLGRAAGHFRRRQPGEHALLELRVLADAVGDGARGPCGCRCRCGVLASMPSQQPQVSVPGAMTGLAHFPPPASSASRPRSRKFGIVGELRDLQPADRNHAVLERRRIGRGHALELLRPHRFDAFDRLRGGDDAAQVHRLAEREVVGMEHRRGGRRAARRCRARRAPRAALRCGSSRAARRCAA